MQNDRRGGGGRSREPRGGSNRDFGREEFRRPRTGGERRHGGFGTDGRSSEGRPSDRPRSYARPARDDDGGMSIRLDPRRLSSLKQLAGEAGMRPGELVTSWVEERIDSLRGQPVAAATRQASASSSADVARLADALAQLSSRVEALSTRVDGLTPSAAPATGGNGRRKASGSAAPANAPAASTATNVEAPTPKRRGRPPKSAQSALRPKAAASDGNARRVPLHQAIISVINQHGPLSASDIASAIQAEGAYQAPRSDKPLDAATVNSRVSNPVYRSLFRREDGRIALANGR